MDRILVGDEDIKIYDDFPNKDMRTVIDSGTSLLYFNTTVHQRIVDSLNKFNDKINCNYDEKLAMVKCTNCHGDISSSFPVLTFTINNFDMFVYPSDYIFKYFGSCLAKI